MTFPPILSAAALLLATLAPHVAHAETILLEPGDVFCALYDPETETCETLTQMQSQDGDRAVESSSMILLYPTGGPITVALQSRNRLVDGQYCYEPGSGKIVLSPEDHPWAGMTRMFAAGAVAFFDRKKYCVMYRRCGSDVALITFLDDAARPDLSDIGRVFRADDPRSTSVTVRPILIEDDDPAEIFPLECIPLG